MKKIIFSKTDIAGTNIAKILSAEHKLPLVEYSGEIIHIDSLPKGLEDCDLCIVASKHKSESGIPTLTIHSPGNFGAAGAGGREKELGIAPALYLREGLINLKKYAVPGFEVCFEVTHHGPTILNFPIVFVEVGSSEKEWSNLDACSAVAETIKNLFQSEPDNLSSAIGFGGGHYAKKFSEVTDYALGHICPKYNLAHLDKEMLNQMVEKTVPRPRFALVEKKGLGTEKEKVHNLLKETNLDVVLI